MALTNNKRGKAKYLPDYTLRDTFTKEFQEANPKITWKLYKKVFNSFIKGVVKMIIEESFDFRMFYRLGYIGIRKKKIKKKLDENGNLIHYNRAVDWGSTLKLWEELYNTKDREELKKIPDKKLIFFDNKDNGGFTYKVYWDKYVCNIKHQSKYAFRPARDFQRDINKYSKENEVDYYELKPYT